MGPVVTTILMAPNMRVNGWRTSSMARASNFLWTVRGTRVITKTALRTVRGSALLQMALFIGAPSRATTYTAMVFILGAMDAFMRANGTRTRCMAAVSSHGMTVESTKVNTETT